MNISAVSLLRLLCLLGLLLPRLLRAQQPVPVAMEDQAPARISYTTQSNLAPSHAWMPVLVHIENQSHEEHSWTAQFQFQQYAAMRSGQPAYMTMVSLERFTVAANSTLDKVVYVQAGQRGGNYVPLRVETSGPWVRFPSSMLPCTNAVANQYGYIAASPSLSDVLSGLRDASLRRVVYTARDGSLQTRSLSPGMRLMLKISNGASVTISAKGAPAIVPSPSGGDPITVKESPNGDLTVNTPTGVFVEMASSRMDSTAMVTATTTTFGGPGVQTGRRITVRGAGPSGLGSQVTRTYMVMPGGEVELSFSDKSTLTVPPSGKFTFKPSSTSITVQDGPNDEVTVQLSNGVHVDRYSSHGPTMGGSRSGFPGGGAAAGIGSNVAKVSAGAWPADARVWSNFTLVVMDTDEWGALDEARRVALRDWVIGGGILVLSPDSYRPTRETEDVGMGQIVHLEKSVRDCSQSDLVALGLKDLDRRQEPWTQVRPELLSKNDLQRMQILHSQGYVLLLLLLFAFLVGPVTLFKIAPAGKRHRLFLVIPGLGLGMSVLLALIVVLRDGTGGVGVRRALVLLAPEEKRALVTQQQVSRTGILLGSEFSLDEETRCIWEAPDNNPGQSGGASFSTTLAREKNRLSGDWFASRTVQTQSLVRVLSTRARVDILPSEGEPGGFSARSNLSCPLQQFLYVDTKGQWWGTETLSPGTLVRLTRLTDLSAQSSLLLLYPKPREAWFYAMGGPTELGPIETLHGIQWKDTSVLYCGRVAAKETEVSP